MAAIRWCRVEAIIIDVKSGSNKKVCLNRIDIGFTIFILHGQGELCRREINSDFFVKNILCTIVKLMMLGKTL